MWENKNTTQDAGIDREKVVSGKGGGGGVVEGGGGEEEELWYRRKHKTLIKLQSVFDIELRLEADGSVV